MIVTLLGWSVNQPATACIGMRPRAAAVVQAGASPAFPEPSLTGHNCCPGKKPQTASTQPSPVSNCSIRPTSDRRCGTVSHDSQGLPSPHSSVKPPAAKMFVLVTNALPPSPRSVSGALFAAVPSPPSSISSRHRSAQLRPCFPIQRIPLRVSAWGVLPTVRSIEINQNFEVEKMKFRMIAVIRAFANGRLAPRPNAPQDSSKDAGAKHSRGCCREHHSADSASAATHE